MTVKDDKSPKPGTKAFLDSLPFCPWTYGYGGPYCDAGNHHTGPHLLRVPDHSKPMRRPTTGYHPVPPTKLLEADPSAWILR